jgi:protein tyrosine phosphatase (PTP) superfamily phosphohydrolase (DUF442 family)
MQTNNIESIFNYQVLSEKLASAGQPERDHFKQIQSAGYQVVINLAMPDSGHAIPDEASLVEGLGMEYLAIPVVWSAPQPANLAAFFQAMDDRQEQKVFVHCAMNFRASTFIFLYRVLRQHTPLEEARQTMLEMWEPDDTWQNFIDSALAKSAGTQTS